MATHVSYESAVAVYEKKCSELLHKSVLLEAQLADQGKRITELEQENERLRQQTPQDAKAKHAQPIPLGQAAVPGAAGETG